MREIDIKVTIRVEDNGSVNCWHDFLSDDDRAKAASIGGGANQEIAHALLIAALRREAYSQLLIDMSQSPDNMLNDWMNGQADQAERKLIQNLQTVVQKVSKDLSLLVVRTIFNMMARQSGG